MVRNVTIHETALLAARDEAEAANRAKSEFLANMSHGLLREIEAMMSVRISEKGLIFSSETPPDLPRHIRVDAGKLRQVLINLPGNAIKFTSSGGVQLRILVAPKESAEELWLRFDVEDSGPGILESASFDPRMRQMSVHPSETDPQRRAS